MDSLGHQPNSLIDFGKLRKLTKAKCDDLRPRKNGSKDNRQRGITAFSRIAGVGKSTISKFLSEDEPQVENETADKLCQALGITFNDILKQTLPTDTQKITSETGRSYRIPYYESVSAGPLSITQDDPADYWSIDSSLIKRPDETFLVHVSGNSMVDEGIFDKDVLMVEVVKDLRNLRPETIVVVSTNDGATVKKYLESDQRNSEFVLRPANIAEPDEYKRRDITIKEQSDGSLPSWGKVIGLIRRY